MFGRCFRGKAGVDATKRNNADNADDDHHGTLLLMSAQKLGLCIITHVDVGHGDRCTDEKASEQEVEDEICGTQRRDIFYNIYQMESVICARKPTCAHITECKRRTQ